MSLVDCLKRKASKVKEHGAKRPRVSMDENDAGNGIGRQNTDRKYATKKSSLGITRAHKTSVLVRRRTTEQKQGHLTPFRRRSKKWSAHLNTQPEQSLTTEVGKKSSVNDSFVLPEQSKILHDVTNPIDDFKGCNNNAGHQVNDLISYDFDSKLNLTDKPTINVEKQSKRGFTRSRISAAEAAAIISNSFTARTSNKTARAATSSAANASSIKVVATICGKTATTSDSTSVAPDSITAASFVAPSTRKTNANANKSISVAAANAAANNDAAAIRATASKPIVDDTTKVMLNKASRKSSAAATITTGRTAASRLSVAGKSAVGNRDKATEVKVARKSTSTATAAIAPKVTTAAGQKASRVSTAATKTTVKAEATGAEAGIAVKATYGVAATKQQAIAGSRQIEQRRDDENDVFPGYEEEILKYCVSFESNFRVPENFMKKQNKITTDNRELLLDWLVQVQVHEKLSDATFHLTVQLLDQYIWKRGGVAIGRLQLVGVACLLVASKYEDRYPPAIRQLVYLTDYSYKDTEVLDMERQVLSSVSFLIPSVTGLTYVTSLLKSISHIVTVAEYDTIRMMTYYLLDLTTMAEYFSSVLPSVKSTSAVALALTLLANQKCAQSSPLNISTNPRLTRSRSTDMLCRCSGMLSLSKMAAGDGPGARIVVSSVSQKDVIECMKELLAKLRSISTTERKGVYIKFSSPMYYCISADECIAAASTLIDLEQAIL